MISAGEVYSTASKLVIMAYREPAIRAPTNDHIKQIASDLGFHLDEVQSNTIQESIAESLSTTYQRLYDIPDPKLPVKYPRTPGYRPAPEDNPYNAWYWKCYIEGAPTGKLHGKTIAVKDHICVAGVPMMIGSQTLSGYVPDEDATVVTRVLDAGGTVVGKAVCEELCLSGGSMSAATGPVRNPHDETRMAGGSSSGCAVLVVGGHVDMAIGGDQGGSIRNPSSRCGIVGLKPTYGLVPYTGACPCEFTLDHLGPMARTVQDVALLLEVMAGYDCGLDPRQSQALIPPSRCYSEKLTANVSGLRIGILKEGFGHYNSERDVDDMVRKAADRLSKKTGVAVQEVSVPMHNDGKVVHDVINDLGTWRVLLDGKGFGLCERGHYTTSLQRALTRGLKMNANDLCDEMKVVAIMGKFLHDCNHETFYSKAQNLAMKLSDAYDEALKNVDVLILPTNPMKAKPFPSADSCLKDRLKLLVEHSANTGPFNVSGHPALSISAGMSQGLPVGLMIVGRKYEEDTVLNVAYAYEAIRDSS